MNHLSAFELKRLHLDKTMNLAGQNILVVGLARTGVALCRFLSEHGAKVTVTDQASLKPGGPAETGLGWPKTWAWLSPNGEMRCCVLSPGCRRTSRLMAAKAAGLSVIGELELPVIHPRLC
jgi:UDP-N-acetylmuramoylalanine--D-glutamate ligase